jgi:hypothetical protein
MDALKEFYNALSPAMLRTCRRLNTPEKIQEYLDAIDYCSDVDYISPLTLMKTRTGCCLEGALFAAAMFRCMGHVPMILEMTSVRDDVHVIALFRKNGLWGAVAKSNYVGLRARQPIYRTIRELVLTYFEFYYNLKHERTLRGYSVPLNLVRFDSLSWMIRDDNLDVIGEALTTIRHFPLFPKQLAKTLPHVGTDVSKAYHP